MVEITDVKVSLGAQVEDGDRVGLLYRLALSEADLGSGTLIESTYSPERPIEVIVEPGELLAGVYEGLLGMHGSGSVRVIRIPAEKGYGKSGFRDIRPGADLWLEVCVVYVSKSHARAVIS